MNMTKLQKAEARFGRVSGAYDKLHGHVGKLPPSPKGGISFRDNPKSQMLLGELTNEYQATKAFKKFAAKHDFDVYGRLMYLKNRGLVESKSQGTTTLWRLKQ